jgi:hypothetical protein
LGVRGEPGEAGDELAEVKLVTLREVGLIREGGERRQGELGVKLGRGRPSIGHGDVEVEFNVEELARKMFVHADKAGESTVRHREVLEVRRS